MDEIEGLVLEEAPAETPAPKPEAPKEEPLEGLDLGEVEEPAKDDEIPKEIRPQGEDDSGEIPEKYEFDAGDDAYNERVGKVARELKLTQKQASKLIDAEVEASEDYIVSMAQKWVEEAKADPEIGGKNFVATTRAARAVFDKYAENGELRRVLAYSGITNHPAFLKMFAHIARDLNLTGERKPLFPNSHMES